MFILKIIIAVLGTYFWHKESPYRSASYYRATIAAYLSLMAKVIVPGCWPHHGHRTWALSIPIGTPKKRINPKLARWEALITRARIIFSILIICTKRRITLNKGHKKWIKERESLKNLVTKRQLCGSFLIFEFSAKHILLGKMENSIIVNENFAGARGCNLGHVQRKRDSPLSPADKSESFRFANSSATLLFCKDLC